MTSYVVKQKHAYSTGPDLQREQKQQRFTVWFLAMTPISIVPRYDSIVPRYDSYLDQPKFVGVNLNMTVNLGEQTMTLKFWGGIKPPKTMFWKQNPT